MLDPVSIFDIQHGLDGISVRPWLVMTYAAYRDCGLTVVKCLTPLSRVFQRESPRTQDPGGKEAHPGLPRDDYRLVEKCERGRM